MTGSGDAAPRARARLPKLGRVLLFSATSGRGFRVERRETGCGASRESAAAKTGRDRGNGTAREGKEKKKKMGMALLFSAAIGRWLWDGMRRCARGCGCHVVVGFSCRKGE
jgi:hypothetical protein